MDRVKLKATIKSMDWEFLEEVYDIRDSQISSVSGTIAERGQIRLPVVRKDFNRNDSLKMIEISGTRQHITILFNPNRLFAKAGRNIYQIKKNEEMAGAIKWVEDTLKEQFKIELKKSGREYQQIHYNIDIKLKDEPYLYGKVWELLADTSTNSDIYAKKLKGNRRIINGTSFILSESKQVNYDKGLEQFQDDIKIHRFETRWDTMKSIQLTFHTTNCGKITISALRKKIAELFEEHVFNECFPILQDYEDKIYKSLVLQREQSPGAWVGAWIGEIKEYIFDYKLLKEAMRRSGMNEAAIKKNMKRATEILARYERNDIERYKHSYKGNYRRLNEVYRQLTGKRENLF